MRLLILVQALIPVRLLILVQVLIPVRLLILVQVLIPVRLLIPVLGNKRSGQVVLLASHLWHDLTAGCFNSVDWCSYSNGRDR